MAEVIYLLEFTIELGENIGDVDCVCLDSVLDEYWTEVIDEVDDLVGLKGYLGFFEGVENEVYAGVELVEMATVAIGTDFLVFLLLLV